MNTELTDRLHNDFPQLYLGHTYRQQLHGRGRVTQNAHLKPGIVGHAG
ncbi:MAG: hypothetical protein HHJ18_19265 [Polaromonas sp.]|nr:hypothetical protein [Polaromonas sp.]